MCWDAYWPLLLVFFFLLSFLLISFNPHSFLISDFILVTTVYQDKICRQYILLFLIFKNFLYLKREGKRKSAQDEGEKQRIPKRLRRVEPDEGLEPVNHEIMT